MCICAMRVARVKAVHYNNVYDNFTNRLIYDVKFSGVLKVRRWDILD